MDSLNFGNERYFDKAYRKYAKEYACPLGGYGAKFLAWVYTDVNPNSCGNGSAMRVGPCGCLEGNPAVCQTTVPMAVSCFINSDSYEDCILKAIQFGWDTDTQAAIAGSIAGAYYQNFSDISNEIWESFKKNKYIKEIVDI